MRCKYILTLSAYLILTSSLYAQVKYEREYRIKEHDVPKLAQSFIDSVFSESQVRWYAEISHEGKTIEAKVRRNHTRYSIEFDLEGNILDVEFEIRMDDLPDSTLINIENNLESIFDRFRITRIQEQVLASRTGYYLFLKNGATDGIAINYEITIRGRENRKTRWYEFLFDNEGHILSRIPIVFRNSDILEF
jgi:uncharacterized protein YxjI